MRKALLLFGLMAAAQWFVPWWGIRQHEQVLRLGIPLCFRTAPVDPHDPFRGEYVILRFVLEDEVVANPADAPWEDGEEAFVLLGNAGGEATVQGVQRTRPNGAVPYIVCTMNVWSRMEEGDSLFSEARIDLPFDRFYLQQGKGPRTEALLDQRSTEEDPELPAYASVRVLEGLAVIEDLIVGDRSIHRWMEEDALAR
jgi:uncharacterized membrane-anchored protein